MSEEIEEKEEITITPQEKVSIPLDASYYYLPEEGEEIVLKVDDHLKEFLKEEEKIIEQINQTDFTQFRVIVKTPAYWEITLQGGDKVRVIDDSQLVQVFCDMDGTRELTSIIDTWLPASCFKLSSWNPEEAEIVKAVLS